MKERQSNIELLRIVAMLMILTVHVDGASLGLPDADTVWSCYDWVRTLAESWAIVGVNLFVLISGYFGIRLTRRRLINYVGICAFYSVGLYASACIAKPSTFTVSNTVNALLVFSKSDLWFLRDYLFLMLLAPMLNAALEHIDRRQSDYLLAAMAVINCYFGWLLGCSVNPTGYNLMQLLFIYIAGDWLSRHTISIKAAAAVYAVATAGIVIAAAAMPYPRAYAYNQPCVVAAAMALFVMFTHLRINSRWINSIAANTLAVYIIHKNPAVWGGFIKPYVQSLAAEYSGIVLFGACTAFIIAVFTACILADKLRTWAWRRL